MKNLMADKRGKTIVSVVAVFVLIALAFSLTVFADWPQHGMSQNNTRQSNSTFGNTNKFAQNWNLSRSLLTGASPVVVGTSLYIAGHTNIIEINISNGFAEAPPMLLFTNISLRFNSTVAVFNGTLYAGFMSTTAGTKPGVMAINISNSVILWRYNTTGNVTMPVTYFNYAIYAADAAGTSAKLYALNSSNGAQLWNISFNGDHEMVSAPAVGNRSNQTGAKDYAIFTLTGNDTGSMLHAYNTSNGVQLWNYSLNQNTSVSDVVYFQTPPTKLGSLLFITDEDESSLRKINASNGVELGKFTRAGGMGHLAIAVTKNSTGIASPTLFVSTGSDTGAGLSANTTYAVNLSNMVQLWNFTANNEAEFAEWLVPFNKSATVSTMLLVATDLLPNSLPQLMILNTSNGVQLANRSSSNIQTWNTVSTPAVAHGQIFALDSSGTLFALTNDTIPPEVVFQQATNATLGSQNSPFGLAGTHQFNVSVVDLHVGNISSVIFNFSNGTSTFTRSALRHPGTNYWNFSLDITTMLQGLANVTVYATDTLDNQNNTVNLSFYVDYTAPNSSFVNPLAGANIVRNFSGTVQLNVSTTDNFTDVDTVRFNISNGSVTFLRNATNVGGNFWNVSLDTTTLVDGVHNFFIWANDSSNNLNNTQNRTFVVDNTAPNVNFSENSVAANANVSSSAMIFNATVTDATTQVKVVYFNFTNGSVAQGFIRTATAGPNNTYNVSITASHFVEGRHSYTILANDTLDNVNKSQTRFFTVDRTVPSINITSLNGTNFSTTTPTLHAIFSDNLALQANCSAIVDGAVAVSNATAFNVSNINFILPAQGQGVHNYIINCTDPSGNTNSSVNFTFTIDTVAPVVLTNAGGVANNSILSTGTLVFNFTIYDATSNLQSVRFNFSNGTSSFIRTASNQGGNFWNVSFDISSLAEGRQNVTVLANDTLGNLNDSIRLDFTVDRVAPVVLGLNNGLNNSNLTSRNYQFNVTVTDLTTSVHTVRFNFTNGSNSFIRTATNVGGNFWNVSLDISTVNEGVQNITILANDTANNLNNSIRISFTVDKTPPFVHQPATDLKGSLGFGLIHNVPDEFFSTLAGNNNLNISINVTGNLTAIANVTFNFSQVCGNVVITKTSLEGGRFYANCTITDNRNFALRNITIKSCDVAGNCNTTLYRSITIYNFTRPPNVTGEMEFTSTTTNLAAETNLSNVQFVVQVRLNGSKLPGSPWDDFRLAGTINFSAIDFTDPTVQASLSNLATAINISIKDPSDRAYGGSRIFINTSSFPALDTNSSVTLYNLPFLTFNTSFLTNETGGTGGIGNVSFTRGADGTGNLSFTVSSGFSAYIINDTQAPIITINSPAGNSIGNTLVFNFTFNGTGTQVDNTSIQLNITNSTGGIFTFNYSNMTCVTKIALNEVIECNITASNVSSSIDDDTYNFTVIVRDFGGSSGNQQNSSRSNITLDTTSPSITFGTPKSGHYNRSTFMINVTVQGSPTHVQYKLVNGTNSSDVVVNYTNMSNQGGNFWNATFTITSVPDNNYTLFINASDLVGNLNISNITIGIDDTKPSISSLSCGDVTVGASVSCSCTATDNSESFGGSVSTTISHSGSASTGTKTATCNATDSAGNSVTTSTTYTVSAASSSSTSGGGGGGGASGGVATGVQGQFEKKVWVYINAGETATLKVRNGEIGVTEVSFTVDSYTPGPSLKVRKVETLPSSVKSFTGKAYKTIEISHTGLKNHLAGTQTIKLKVEKSWLKSNSLGNSDVALFRYANDQWNQLNTTFDKEDETYAYFTAETPGFSYFVIGEKTDKTPTDLTNETTPGGAPGEATEQPTKEQPTKEQPTEKQPTEKPDESTREADTKKSAEVWSWWWVIFLLVLLLVAIIWLSKVKTKKTKPLKKK